MSKSVFSILMLSLFLFSCNNLGKKGAWDKEFKAGIIDKCAHPNEDLPPGTDLSDICQCAMDQLEQAIAPDETNSILAQELILQFTDDCMSQTLGAKGAWDAALKQQILDQCIANTEGIHGASQEMAKEACSCSVDKIEAEFAMNEIETSAYEKRYEEIQDECTVEVTR